MRSLIGGLTRLQTTKWVELFRVKEFVAAALGANDEVFVEAKNVHSFLPSTNCCTRRQSPRYDYTNVFSSNFGGATRAHRHQQSSY